MAREEDIFSIEEEPPVAEGAEGDGIAWQRFTATEDQDEFELAGSIDSVKYVVNDGSYCVAGDGSFTYAAGTVTLTTGVPEGALIQIGCILSE